MDKLQAEAKSFVMVHFASQNMLHSKFQKIYRGSGGY
jgi:hypothetical protein